jgi:hypothetical protein
MKLGDDMKEDNIIEIHQSYTYNDFAYGNNSYQNFQEQKGIDIIKDKVYNLKYELYNYGADFNEGILGNYYEKNVQLKLKWNRVKDAKAYAVYKGLSDRELRLYTITEDNFYFDSKLINVNEYYQIVPLFDSSVLRSDSID